MSDSAHHSQAYDVTKFLDHHPGGRTQFIVAAGRDVSVIFRSYHKEETFKFACNMLWFVLIYVQDAGEVLRGRRQQQRAARVPRAQV